MKMFLLFKNDELCEQIKCYYCKWHCQANKDPYFIRLEQFMNTKVSTDFLKNSRAYNHSSPTVNPIRRSSLTATRIVPFSIPSVKGFTKMAANKNKIINIKQCITTFPQCMSNSSSLFKVREAISKLAALKWMHNGPIVHNIPIYKSYNMFFGLDMYIYSKMKNSFVDVRKAVPKISKCVACWKIVQSNTGC